MVERSVFSFPFFLPALSCSTDSKRRRKKEVLLFSFFFPPLSLSDCAPPGFGGMEAHLKEEYGASFLSLPFPPLSFFPRRRLAVRDGFIAPT